jgi:hypothetical protein
MRHSKIADGRPLSGEERRAGDITGTTGSDAVDGAHSAASRCHRVVARIAPLEGSHCERSKQFPRWLADAVEYMQAVFDDVDARRARDAI